MAATSEQSDDLDWQNFFQEYQVFSKKRDAQKARGINDYSLLASLLSVNDEVRLHSRFLYSILNPRGNHYQGALFLELFLKEIDLTCWLNLDCTIIQKEKSGIDLYLTDGTNHLIIENKLDAKDQWQQIEKYVTNVIGNNSAASSSIAVVYLSKDRSTPSQDSLGKWRLSSCLKYLENNNETIVYRNMNYSTDILRWLLSCKKQVINFANLFYTFDEYEKVVLLALRKYRSPVMNLKSFFDEENGSPKSDKLKYLLEIERELPNLRAEWFYEAMTEKSAELVKPYHVELLTKENCPVLKSHLFEREKAIHCMTRCEDDKVNQGVFWRVTSGPYKDKVAVFLWMSVTALHVGCMRLEKNENGIFDFSEKSEDLVEKLESIKPIDGFKLALSNDDGKGNRPKHQAQFITWGEKPKIEVNQFYDFNTSRQGRFLIAILECLEVGKK